MGCHAGCLMYKLLNCFECVSGLQRTKWHFHLFAINWTDFITYILKCWTPNIVWCINAYRIPWHSNECCNICDISWHIHLKLVTVAAQSRATRNERSHFKWFYICMKSSLHIQVLILFKKKKWISNEKWHSYHARHIAEISRGVIRLNFEVSESNIHLNDTE